MPIQGDEWSEAELRPVVSAYLTMLEDERAGRPINKAARRAQLRSGTLSKRTDGAIEYRMQNISYVLERMGRARIQGYLPAANVGSRTESKIAEIIADLEGASQPIKRLSDVVQSTDRLMGVKAVFGPISSHVLCFGGRGNPANATQYYSVAAGAASRAVERPFVIAIGGGKNVGAGYKGRVLNLARLSTVYGPTARLIPDPVEVARLAQWPVAIAVHDVWRFVGNPHLVDDLAMPDRKILAGAQDGIIRPIDKLESLWSALQSRAIQQVILPSPANFYDDNSPRLVGTELPNIPAAKQAEEGKRVWKLQQ